MFNSKKKDFKKATNRFLTGSSLLKAAVAHDKDTLAAISTGQTADDDGIWFSLQTFMQVANRHPGVIQRLVEQQQAMPQEAQLAFYTAIEACKAGNPRLFQGGTVLGQSLLLICLTTAISEDPEALADAMVSLGGLA